MTSLVCKRIAIIGAGPAGLAAAKYLSAERFFDVIDVYEQRSEVGGLWNQTPHLIRDGLFRVPQTNPFGALEKPFWRGAEAPTKSENAGLCSGDETLSHEPELEFLSPVYDTLETNIPLSLMQYSDTPFSEDTQLFPKHQQVQKYLQGYAKDIRHLIKFSTQVTDLRLTGTTSQPLTDVSSDQKPSEAFSGLWTLSSVSLPTGKASQTTYDAVIVGNGHYAVPFIPSIPGIEEWNAKFPGSITHAKYYRRPEDYQDKKLIVVGNSASGLDIGTQLMRHCRAPLLMSSKSASYLAAGFPGLEGKEDVPPIASFDADSKTIRFADGREETGVDAVVFCTGYFYSYPFLSSLLSHTDPAAAATGVSPASPPPSYPILTATGGQRVCNLYKHLFYAPQPTLSFLALTQKVIPFPLAEAQAAVLARVYAGRLTLPPFEHMQAWEQKVLRNLGEKGERDFHTLSFPRDAEYINDMCDWAAEAQGEEAEGAGGKARRYATGGNEGRPGKMPHRWGPWHYWARERFPQIRRAFVELGEARGDAKRLEDVGFDFEAFLEEKQEESKIL